MTPSRITNTQVGPNGRSPESHLGSLSTIASNYFSTSTSTSKCGAEPPGNGLKTKAPTTNPIWDRLFKKVNPSEKPLEEPPQKRRKTDPNLNELLNGYQIPIPSMNPSIQNSLTTIQQQLLILEGSFQQENTRRRPETKEMSTQTARVSAYVAVPRAPAPVPPTPSTSITAPPTPPPSPPMEHPKVSIGAYQKESPEAGVKPANNATVEENGKVYAILEPPPRVQSQTNDTMIERPAKPDVKPRKEKLKLWGIEKEIKAMPGEQTVRSKVTEFGPAPRLSKKGIRIGRPPGSFKVSKPVKPVEEIPVEKDDGNERKCRWKACGQTFTQQDAFVDHVRTHMSENGKLFRKCLWEGCNREDPFDAFYKIQYHVRGHTQERSFFCTEPGCNKAYLRMENLTTHRRSHTGERPYECLICGKKFSNASDRACHKKRVHSTDKPYHCCVENCGRCYTDPSSLRKHFHNNHPELMEEFVAGKHRAYIRNKDRVEDEK